MPASEQLIKDVLGSLDYVDLGKRYHSPLPKELEAATELEKGKKGPLALASQRRAA